MSDYRLDPNDHSQQALTWHYRYQETHDEKDLAKAINAQEEAVSHTAYSREMSLDTTHSR